MRLDHADGSTTDVELARPQEWLDEHDARVGGTVSLEMPEMGAVGDARVLSIVPSRTRRPLAGGRVTGTFRHTSGEAHDLQLAGESQPIGVTATHPFWSVDREAWVSAIDLEVGETLRSHDSIADYGDHVGGSVLLDIPEIDIKGRARATAVESPPTQVYELKLEGEWKLVSATAAHPFWSVDRKAWVSAMDLEIGETLKTLAGTTVV